MLNPRAPRRLPTQLAVGIPPIGNDTDGGTTLTASLRVARAKIQSVFAQVTLAIMAEPRFRHHSIAELQQLVLDPMLAGRVAVASAGADADDIEPPVTGIAFWARVSPEVDAKIREQIRAGIFPVRLQAADWDSGPICWLLDVIAPGRQQATAMLREFRQVVGDEKLFVHPTIRTLVDDRIFSEALRRDDGT